MADRHLSTGQIAKICRVAPRTVCKWIDTGELPGIRFEWRKRNSRLVTREALVAFMRTHEMPEEWLR